MSDIPIQGMDFRQLRNEVQLLRDELAITKRKYEDLLYNLDTENIADGAITAEKLSADMIFSDAIITQTLSSELGNIAELTVDELNTSRKVANYLNNDTSDVGYIRIHKQFIQFIEATTDGEHTQQIADRKGRLLYWKDEEKKASTISETDFPVFIYQYTENIKMQLYFDYNELSGYYNPKMVWGVGTGDGDKGKGFIEKGESDFLFKYVTENGKETELKLSDFVDANMRRLKDCTINKADGEISVTAEGQDIPQTISYSETADSMTFEWEDGFIATVKVV